jgi:hypothetical protein
MVQMTWPTFILTLAASSLFGGTLTAAALTVRYLS